MAVITDKQFTDLVDRINTSTTERREMIQKALAYAAYYSIKDRNADPALRLFAVVGRETNRQNMADWLSEHGAIGFKDNAPFFHEKKWKDHNGNFHSMVELEAALKVAPQWWAKRSHTSEIKDTVDVLELIRAIVKKCDKVKEKGVQTLKHADLITQLSAIANATEYK